MPSHYAGETRGGGAPHGWGVWTGDGMVYSGEFVDGDRHGWGRFEDSAKGETYDGQWSAGSR
jgi:hypothetical protein